MLRKKMIEQRFLRFSSWTCPDTEDSDFSIVTFQQSDEETVFT